MYLETLQTADAVVGPLPLSMRRPVEPRLDPLTRACASIFSADIVSVTMTDRSHQWFLSQIGIVETETPIELSFCRHVIDNDERFVVTDAEKDPRVWDNPSVTGEGGIKSYLGYPIRDDTGRCVGALCVAFYTVRTFSQTDHDVLNDLAASAGSILQTHVEAEKNRRLNETLITEKERLLKTNKLLRQAEKIGKLGAWEIDLSDWSLRFSDEMFKIAGVEPLTEIEASASLAFYAERDRDTVRSLVRQAAEDGKPFSYEADFFSGDGQTKHVRCTGERITDGSGTRLVGIIQDITETYRAENALRLAAHQDNLTGLLNRNGFDHAIRERIAEHRHAGGELFMLLIDLDGFKAINDTFGHVVGDAILEEIGERLSDLLASGHVLARWGGDEFVVLPSIGIKEHEALALAKEIAARISQRISFAKHNFDIRSCCGISQFVGYISVEEFIRRADLALYEAKSRGRGEIRVFDNTLLDQDDARRSALAKVREALECNRIEVCFEPIVSLETGDTVSTEALMRVRDRDGSIKSAAELLPALLDPEVSKDVFSRMLDLTLGENGQSQMAPAIAINVTASDLLDPDFLDLISQAIRAHSADPHSLIIEITETSLLVADAGRVRAILQKLRQKNIRVALDDFGTGYSSLSHLRDFPIEFVKIDKRFVQEMDEIKESRTIVQTIIEMGNSLDLTVIAEGVESRSQLDTLRAMGCDLAQGYHFRSGL